MTPRWLRRAPLLAPLAAAALLACGDGGAFSGPPAGQYEPWTPHGGTGAVTNGDFEAGSLWGWSISGKAAVENLAVNDCAAAVGTTRPAVVLLLVL